jgi:hypothetical protein
MLETIDAAVSALRAHGGWYTERNLYWAVRRLGHDPGSFGAFRRGPLAARLRRGPLVGLLGDERWDGAPLPPEYRSYFPLAILLVDRPSVVGLFVASGVLSTARLAVVCLDGSPRHVVRWLARGFQAGHRAPIGFLHDAGTTVYPFLIEPLATLVDALGDGEPLAYRDLGLPPRGLPTRRFPFAEALPASEPVTELAALPPRALVAYATRAVLAMVPGDPRMAAIQRRGRPHEAGRSTP